MLLFPCPDWDYCNTILGYIFTAWVILLKNYNSKYSTKKLNLKQL